MGCPNVIGPEHRLEKAASPVTLTGLAGQIWSTS